MKTNVPQSIQFTGLPVLSSESQGWENILVEQFHHPAGEGHCQLGDEHTICLSLAPRPVRLLQIRGGKTYTGLYGKGDIAIMPAQTPFFVRWEGEDQYLQIRLASRFIQTIAQETLDQETDSLELRAEFRTRDPHLESIGLLLLAELKQAHVGSRLYIESLANVLAVHLIRQYAAPGLHLPTYEGGLSQRQVLQVVEYIEAYLQEDIKLTDLAALLGMSQFHFSHLFKQATSITPYQYLLQQRIERAKQLLKQTDRSITEIAFSCGFSSHSHLSKQFRHLTGTTPKAYRAN